MAYTSFDIKKLRQPYTLGTQSPPPTFPDSGVMPQESPIPQVPPNLAQQTQPDTQSETQPPGNDIAGLMAQLNQIYTPETAARDKFNDLLNSVPERNTPGLARKIVAGGMGLGSKDPLGTMEGVMYAPYLRDMAGWKEKTEPTYRAAQMENTANANERQLAGNVLSAKTQADRIAETERRNQANIASREKIEGDKAEINRRKNELIAERQNGTTFTVAGGKLIAHKLDGTVYDTGEDVKNYTPIEVANILAASRKEVANIGATSRENVAETGATSREKVAESKTGAGASSLERNRVRNDTLKTAYQIDPTIKKYIKKNGDKYDFASRPVVTPGGWFSNAVTQEDVDKYDEFRKEVEPNYAPPKGIAPTGSTETPTSDKGIGPSKNVVVGAGAKPQVEKGRIVVQDSTTGKKFTLPAAQVDAFLADPKNKQYRRVQ